MEQAFLSLKLGIYMEQAFLANLFDLMYWEILEKGQTYLAQD